MLSRLGLFLVVSLSLAGQSPAHDHLAASTKGKKEQGQNYTGTVISFKDSTLIFDVDCGVLPRQAECDTKPKNRLTLSVNKYQLVVRLGKRTPSLPVKMPGGRITADYWPPQDQGLVWYTKGVGDNNLKDSIWTIQANKDGRLVKAGETLTTDASNLGPARACESCHTSSGRQVPTASVPRDFLLGSAPGARYVDGEGRMTVVALRGPKSTTISHPGEKYEIPPLGTGTGVFDLTSCHDRGEDWMVVKEVMHSGTLSEIDFGGVSFQEGGVSQEPKLQDVTMMGIGICPAKGIAPPK